MPAVVLLPQALAETYKFDQLLLLANNVGVVDFYQLAVYEHNYNVLYGNTSADFTGSQPPIGKWSFHDVTHTAQIKTGAGHSLCVWADYDYDGDPDLAAGGKLYRNLGNDNHWLKVRLDTPLDEPGRRINRFAIGALVRVHTGDWVLIRQVEGATRKMGSRNDLTLHFGLGKREGQVEVEIRRPNSRLQWLVTDVNRLIKVTPTSECPPTRAFGDWPAVAVRDLCGCE